MTIRMMTASDLDAVIAIADSLPEAPHWPPSAYLAALDPAARPERLALVAQDDRSRITGFIVVTLIAGEAELESIAVAPEAQRRGIARVLASAALAALRSRGCRAILLEVRESNIAARSLYRALNFVETGRRPSYYADPVEDAILMALTL